MNEKEQEAAKAEAENGAKAMRMNLSKEWLMKRAEQEENAEVLAGAPIGSDMDARFVIEKINPIVGWIFHTARQLGSDNAPTSMDMNYLRQGTEKITALLQGIQHSRLPADGWREINGVEDLPKDRADYVLRVRRTGQLVMWPKDQRQYPYMYTRERAEHLVRQYAEYFQLPDKRITPPPTEEQTQ